MTPEQRKIDIMNKSYASQIKRLSDENVELQLKIDVPAHEKVFLILVGVAQFLVIVLVLVWMIFVE